jgi:hypothetical protein
MSNEFQTARAPHEVEDQRNHGEDRQNLNQPTRNMKCSKTPAATPMALVFESHQLLMVRVAFRVPMLQACRTQRVIATQAMAVS